MRAALVGRDAVVEAAAAALESVGRVLLEGPAGIGKTALLRTLADEAAERGVCVLQCAPSETEAALPLAALADVLRPLHGAIARLPEPQRHAVRSALLLEPDSASVDERALAAATYTLLIEAADQSPQGLLLAIDDAPWLDLASERALRFAIRRASARIRVIVTRRSANDSDPRLPLDLDAQVPVERFLVAPLGVGPLHRVVANRLGVSLSRPMISRLTHESGGNPLLAIELTRALLRLSRMPSPGEDLPVPRSVQELVDASMATLDDDSIRAVRLAALLASPRLADLHATDVSAKTLDTAEEVGLVTVDASDRVRFLHPAFASAVRASIPAGVKRRLHIGLAQTSTDPDERARHLALCTTDTDEDVATALAEAALRARSRGAPDQAGEFFARAGALTADATTADRFRLNALLCQFDCGEFTVVAARVDALVRELTGDLLAEALLLRATIAFGLDDLPLATVTAERALAAATPLSRLAGRIHAHLAVFADVAVPARHHAVAALELLDHAAPATPEPWAYGGRALGGSEQALLASVILLVFLNEVRSGLPPRLELLDRALEMEAGTPSPLAGTVVAIWCKGTDQHDRARDRLQVMLNIAASAGDEPLQHEFMQHLAEAETLAGHYERAAAWIADAGELATQLGAGIAAERWLAGMVHVYRGNLSAARAAADAGLSEAAASNDPWLRRISLQLAGFTALADGRTEDAAASYVELAALVDAGGLAEPLASRFEPDWLEACVAIGDDATAEVALERLVRRHERLPRPWTTLGLARSRVLMASAAGGDTSFLVDDLLAARDTIPEDVLPFDRAKCLLVAGLAHRRSRRRGAAREALLAAAHEFEAIGAVSFAARARSEADRTVGRGAAPNVLTASEQRVAELAAGGATNREIADALFITAKTVEANLSRIYRKLTISRRVELGKALAAQNSAHT